MKSLVDDIRFGFRMIVRSPGMSLLAVLALAIGIGANSTVFNIVNSILLSPLPFKDPLKITRIVEKHKERGDENGTCSGANYLDWVSQCQSFDSMCLVGGQNFTLTGIGEPERVRAFLMTPSIFSTFGFQIETGRGFFPDEIQPGKGHVVLLSNGLWKDKFGGDPKAIEKDILLDGEPYRIIGILSSRLGMFEGEAKIWIPIQLEEIQRDRANRRFTVFARLKKGVSLERAQAEIDLVESNLIKEYPDANADWRVAVEASFQQVVRSMGLTYLVLQCAVGFVLLIACSIVASLLLARGQRRLKEISIRTALGATRRRVIRQMLTESILLSLFGGLLGLLFTMWGIEGMVSISDPGIAAWFDRAGVDLNVILYTLVISILAGIAFGTIPALQITRHNINETLKEGGRQESGFKNHQLLGSLVVTQMALSLTLLIGAGLMINSFIRLQNEEIGFNSDNLLTVWFDLPKKEYADAPLQVAFYSKALESLQNLPSVESVAAPQVFPVFGSDAIQFDVEGQEPLPSGQHHTAQVRKINRDYFHALDIPLLKGRFFETTEESDTNHSIIVNEILASKFWSNEDPIGKRLVIPSWKMSSYEIIGVVGNVKNYGLEGVTQPEIYIPFVHRSASTISFIIRSQQNSVRMAGAVRKAIWEIDPNLPLQTETMDQQISKAMQNRKFTSILLSVFSVVALVLSSVGIFGIMAYTVCQRTHEIGIRIALGAQADDVIRMMVRRGIKLALIGIAIGIVGAFGFTRILSSLLYGLSASDPFTYVLVSFLFLLVSVSACYIPARWAAKVDPMIALRCE